MNRGHVALVFCLGFLTATQVAIAQRFERDGLRSNPNHAASRWYHEVERFSKADSVNVDSVLAWMRADSVFDTTESSLELYEANEFLRNQTRRATANGWVFRAEAALPTYPAKSNGFSNAVQSSAVWRNIGPFTWDREAVKQTGSEGIGVLRSIAVHPSNPDVLLVGTISAGVWRSTDAGIHWQPVTDQLLAQQTNQVVFAQSNPLVAFAALDVGLARSTDGGATFSMTSVDGRANVPATRPVDRVAVHPTDANRIVIAYNNELQESTNGGETFAPIIGSRGNYWDVEFAGTGKSVYAVKKDGNWSEMLVFSDGAVVHPAGLPVKQNGASTPRALLATSPAAPNSVWVVYGGAIDTVGGVWGLYVSSDGGQTFVHRCCGSTNGPELPSATNPNLFDYDINGAGLGQITWDMAFAVSNTDTSQMVVGGIFPFVSTNGGRSFTKTSPIHYDVQDALLVNGTLWVSTDGGLQRSDNLGTTMVDRSEGICAVEVWGFGQSKVTNVLTLGAYHLPVFVRDNMVYNSRGYEGGWYAWSGADAMSADVNPDDNSWLYAKPWTSVRAHRFPATDKPPVVRELGIDLGYLSMSNIAFHPNKTYSMVAADHKRPAVMKTVDNAESWQEVKRFSNSIAHVRIAPSNPAVLVVIADARLWYSTNQGEGWLDITPGTEISMNHRLVDVAFNPVDHREVWVAFGGRQDDGKVAQTTDGGQSWTNHSVGIGVDAVNCISVPATSNNQVFVGTEGGVYVCDKSYEWYPYGTGLPRCSVSFLQPDEPQGLLRIGTSRGLWESSLLPGKPIAQLSSNSDTVRCYADVVTFTDRSSTFLDASSWRRWTFPGGSPETSSERQPQIHYSRPGTYSASLVVGNRYGTDSATIGNVVTVLPSECDVVDPQPGGCVDLSGAEDFVTLGTFTGVTDKFTFTAWVKPNGMQPAFSAIFCTDAPVGAKGEIGMQINGDSNQVGYLWVDGKWWWDSGLRLEPDRWNHVALIVNGPKGITVMVNGVASTLDEPAKAQDLSALTFTLGTYHYWTTRNLDAQIDEVRLYNTALGVHDVRRTMHHPENPDNDALLGWYQFNETGGHTFYNVRADIHGVAAAGGRRVVSTIPYGQGVTDTIKLPSGVGTELETLGFTADVMQNQGGGVMLTRIDRWAPGFNHGGQLLGPRYLIVQSLQPSAHSLLTTTIDLRGMIGLQDGATRTYHLWSVDAYRADANWEEVPALVFHQPESRDVVFRTKQHPLARQMLCVSVDGGPVDVPFHRQMPNLWPLPATDVLHVRTATSGGSYVLVDALGQTVWNATLTAESFTIPTAHLSGGMYMLVGESGATPVPIVR